MGRGAKTKENIKNQALELFVAKGVDGTGVREIATASGITEGAIYRHFKGKDELVWTLFIENYTVLAAKLDGLQSQQTDVATKLSHMIQGFCLFFDTDPTLFRFLLLVQHGQLDKVTDDMATPVKVMENVIQAGLDAGDFGDNPGFTASEGTAWVFGVVLQTVTFKIYGRIDGTLASRARTLVKASHGALGL